MLIPLLVLLTTFSRAASAEDETADELYQKGDCKKALPLYEAMGGDLGEFRAAYCRLNLGDAPGAEKGFRKVLERARKNDEARLKLSEALYQEGHYEQAIQEAERVDGGSAQEARILEAQADIELGEIDDARAILNERRFTPDWHAVVRYWRGVAHYRGDERALARKDFESALSREDAPAWVKTAARSWIDQMNHDTRFFRLQADGGFFYDGNISQSAGYFTGGAPSQGGGAPSQQTATSVDLIDRGPWGDATFMFRPSSSDDGSYWETDLGIYLTDYLSYPSYSFESTTAKVIYSSPPKAGFHWFAAGGYQDTRYDYVYYQDYFVPSGGLVWDLSKSLNWTLQASAPIDLFTREGFTLTPSTTLDWRGPVELWAGLSASLAAVTQAVISDSTPPTLVSGNLFTSYKSFAPYIGGAAPLPWLGLIGSLQTGVTVIAYAAENLPSSVTGDAKTPRTDMIYSVSATVSRYLAGYALKVSLTGTLTMDDSSGFKGLTTNGALPNNSYVRPYIALTTSLAL